MKKLFAIMAVLLLASCAGMGVRDVEMTAADQKLTALTDRNQAPIAAGKLYYVEDSVSYRIDVDDFMSYSGIAHIVASGSATFNPTEVADGACSSAVDGGTATGVATTDRIVWNFSGDATSTTGYNPSGDVGYVWAYPAADHVYFKFCNKSGTAIDPGSITINWMVLR